MSDEVSKEVQEQLSQLQMLEQNMQNFVMQRQMMQSQLMEVESAIDGLKDAQTAYRIVGNIMVSAKKPELEKDLKEKQVTLKKRVDSLESQEKKIRDKAESLQKEIMKALK